MWGGSTLEVYGEFAQPMSTDIHLSRDLLRAVYEDDDSTALLELLEIVQDHLSSLCPTCAEEIEAYSREQRSAVPILRSLETTNCKAIETLLKETKTAVATLMDKLRELPAKGRWPVIARAEHLHGRALVSALVAESRGHSPSEPMEALLWAQLAEQALQHIHLGAEAPDLWVLAIAYQANSHRLHSSFRSAEEDFMRARVILQSVEVANPAIAAELDSLQASLHLDLYQLTQARQLLHRAAFLFKSIHADDQVGCVLIKLGIAHEYDNDPVAAMSVTHGALCYLDPDHDRHLFLCAMLCNARYYYDQGDYNTALDIVAFDEDLIKSEIANGNTWLDFNLRWLRGRIAAAREEFSDAERYLSSVRKEAIERVDAYNVLHVSIELALLYFHQCRREEALSLSTEALNLARAHRLPHDAIAALLVLTDTLRLGQPAA